MEGVNMETPGQVKRKRKKDNKNILSNCNISDSDEDNTETKYLPYKVPKYERKYPENSTITEFIVFLSRKDEQTIMETDKLAISQAIRQQRIHGVKHLKIINKYKIGVVFDVSNNANACLSNKTILNELNLKANIPASSTEVTGVLRGVPVAMSNKKIFSLITSTRNVIQVRRFTRRVKDEGMFKIEPTQTIAVTFASTQLPDCIYLDSWRHEVSQYIPPVKQCLKCLRFGHIATYCKNSEKCSICTENHNYRQCKTSSEEAKCINCGGNHIAISSQCPIKKQKINEIRIKTRTATYTELFNGKDFPPLPTKTKSTSQLESLFESEKFLHLLTESISKILVLKSKGTPMCSNNYKEVLLETFKRNYLKPHNG